MAEGTFEYEQMRAELLNLPEPNREEFEANQKLRLEAEKEEIETEEIKQLEAEDASMTYSSGKLEELNSILSRTSLKLNKFKKTCGSLTNMLKFRPSPSESATGSNENINKTMTDDDGGKSINDALDVLDTMKDNEKETNIKIVKSSALDLQSKMTSHLDKLDSMLNNADKAHYSMQEQNKEMKKMTK